MEHGFSLGWRSKCRTCRRKVRPSAVLKKRPNFRVFTVTYQYSDIDQHEALYNIAREYPGKIHGLAHAMGQRQGKVVSPNVLRNKLRPGISTHVLNAEEFSLVVELCEEAGVKGAKGPLLAMCWRHGLVASEVPPASVTARCLMGTVAALSREFAELVGEVTKGAADGRISADEAERIEKESFELMQAVMSLRVVASRAAEQPGASSA